MRVGSEYVHVVKCYFVVARCITHPTPVVFAVFYASRVLYVLSVVSSL